jgi:hypothetical protein
MVDAEQIVVRCLPHCLGFSTYSRESETISEIAVEISTRARKESDAI